MVMLYFGMIVVAIATATTIFSGLGLFSGSAMNHLYNGALKELIISR